MTKNIPFEVIEQIIIPEDLELKGKVSYNEVKKVLEKEPFNFLDPEKIDFLSRFLTEDSQQSFVEFKPEAYCGITIIREKFINIIGDYDLISNKEANIVEEEI